MQNPKIFAAYPSQPPLIGQIVADAKPLIQNFLEFKDWKDADNWGKHLISPLLKEIEDSDYVFADITRSNFNVTFEIGYAIARGKRTLLSFDSSTDNDVRDYQKVGIFDTLGHRAYHDVGSFIELFKDLPTSSPLSIPNFTKRESPVYILETDARTPVMSKVISGIKKSRLRFHSHNPQENARLPATTAIRDVARSVGVIVPILSKSDPASYIHNVKAAFVAGLAYGLSKETLFFWLEEAESPLDIRDLGVTLKHPDDLPPILDDFAVRVYAAKPGSEETARAPENRLEQLDIGDPTAENEFQTLGNYYVPTDSFQRAMRGEINLVVGRKGSGKTALLAQLRDKKRSAMSNVVVDLLPEGYQLVRLKENVVEKLTEGAALHLISTYWQFIIYSEIAYKLLEKDKETHVRQPAIFDRYVALQKAYFDHEFLGQQGDFSERMTAAADRLAGIFIERFGSSGGDLNLNSPEVTQLMHEEQIANLRREVIEYLRLKDEVWLLFDNLDKGWKSYGLSREDVFILRCLLDASRKVAKIFERHRVPYSGIIFVRNDVYQLMVREDPDFGKQSRAELDWNDREQLRGLLLQRVRVGLGASKSVNLNELISSVMCPLVDGQDSLDFIIDHSLMRPRNLLKIFSYARSSAINSGRSEIAPEDLKKGAKTFANDLIVDVSNEIRDTTSVEDVLYAFIECDALLSKQEIFDRLSDFGVESSKYEDVIASMLYSGILGVDRENRETQYIYDLNYDLRRMDAVRRKSEDKGFWFHPAIRSALE